MLDLFKNKLWSKTITLIKNMEKDDRVKNSDLVLKPVLAFFLEYMKRSAFSFWVVVIFLGGWSSLPSKALAEENVISLRKMKLEIGGELELEIIDAQSNGRKSNPGGSGQLNENNNSNPRMSIDKIVITPRVHVAEDILFQADIEFGTDKPVKLDEAWIKFTNLPGNSWVTLGQEDPFIHVSRKTESYPILGYAFWQDEDLGLFTGGNSGPIYWRFSATNGRRLRDRQASEDKTFPISTYDDDNGENNANKQIGVGLGLKHVFKEGHTVDLFPYWYTADLSDQDISYLNTIAGYTDTNNRDQTLYGVNLDYTLGGFNFFAQYMGAKDGVMERDGWYVQPSYKQKLGMNRLKSVEVILRYEQYNVDLPDVPTDARTWDRQTTTVAVISEIVRGFKIKTEYYFNQEDTGGASVDNNELLVQAEVKF